MTIRSTLLAALLAAAASSTPAAVVAQWHFNSATKPVTTGAGGATKYSLLNGTTSTFATDSGSSDVGTHTQGALNTAGYAAQNGGNLTRGVAFFVDTTGYDHISLHWDQQNSGTASAWTQLQYTLDGGLNWTFAKNQQMTKSGSFANSFGTFDFSGILGAGNNVDFGIRMLAMFEPGKTAYKPTTSASYGTAGTIRYDMVTFEGLELPAPPEPEPVPEPAALLLALTGLGAAALRRRSR